MFFGLQEDLMNYTALFSDRPGGITRTNELQPEEDVLKLAEGTALISGSSRSIAFTRGHC